MLVAGFDTETTGLSVVDDHIVQAAVVLWDTSAPSKKAKAKFDELINRGPSFTIKEEVIAVHGITLEDLQKYGSSPEFVLNAIGTFFAKADAIVAHNGLEFDKPMYENNCKRHGVIPVEKLWIDTSCDIEFPAHISTRKLTHLAAEHGFVNPFPHDATSDVLTMLKIADCYDWDKMVEFAKSPTLFVRADTTFQQKELAKKQGFRWDAERKIWGKSIKEFQLSACEKAAQDSGFKITVLKGGTPK